MKRALNVQSVSLKKDDKTILKGVNITLPIGEIGSLLGESGCGKTTLLRAIAGLETISEGEISWGNTTLSSPTHLTPPAKRKIALVFQDLALFPHLNVWQNICFSHQFGSQTGFKIRSLEVDKLLKDFKLHDLKGAFIHQLSGGQQQRVALLRALLSNAELILLDEPFSSQDNQLKETLLEKVAEFIYQHQKTALMVTHHQQEALSFSDKVGVMDQGRMQQWGSAYEVYHQPKSPFVANFLGKARLLDAVVLEGAIVCPLGRLPLKDSDFDRNYQDGQKLKLLIRASDCVVKEQGAFKAKLVRRQFLGDLYLYELELIGDTNWQQTKPIRIPAFNDSHLQYEVGQWVHFDLNLQHIVVFDTDHLS